MFNLLFLNILAVIIGLIVLAIIPSLKKYEKTIKQFSFFVSIFVLINSLFIWAYFDKSILGFQSQMQIVIVPAYNLNFSIGLDGISLCFLLLTAVIMPLCLFASWNMTTNVKTMKQFIIILLSIEFFLIVSFIVTDLLFFFIFFESVLIPMFIMIGYWGARERKIKAAYYLFLYTLFGSLFMLFGILYLYNLVGTTDFAVILKTSYLPEQQILLWVCFFIPFAIKIPMFPFHIWLPEAHVEAPTIGSIILASLLLKLGSYGFLRFTIPMFPYGSSYFMPIIYILGILSVLYASLSTIRQIDMKRTIAYSSIAHMNLIVLGLFSYTQIGIDGAIYLMIGHGIVSTALFFCVGVLYDRYHTRLIRYYSGLAQIMPVFAIFFLLFTMANMSFPGTSNFIGELLILVGIFEKNTAILFAASSGIILSAIYSIWLYNRICMGTLKTKYIQKFIDITFIEFTVLSILLFLMLILGINSNFLLELTSAIQTFLTH